MPLSRLRATWEGAYGAGCAENERNARRRRLLCRIARQHFCAVSAKARRGEPMYGRDESPPFMAEFFENFFKPLIKTSLIKRVGGHKTENGKEKLHGSRSVRNFQALPIDHLPLDGGRHIPRSHTGEGRVSDFREGGFAGDRGKDEEGMPRTFADSYA